MTSRTPDWFASGFPHVWMPYTQMKTARPPLAVERTTGSRIVLADGRELIDGIASWWTACHGYAHPYLRDAVQRQLDAMPHVMFAGLVHEPALRLARRLVELLPGDLERAFFSESGSVSVEIAMKMALGYQRANGHRARTRVVGFENGYHGDTLATTALCVNAAPLPSDDERVAALERMLDREESTIAALIVEPLVQGAGGMLFHAPATLRRLRALADRYGVLLIFDEIFTGFGRTGTMFACEQAAVVPDIITLSKALTGGTLPLAATIARGPVFDAFWSDDPADALVHGPTYMANPLGCAAANASLDLFEREGRLHDVRRVSAGLRALEECRAYRRVRDVRVIGALGVVELDRIDDLDALRAEFVAQGVWIRPFRNVVYLAPAFTIDPSDLGTLTDAVVATLRDLDAA